MSDTNGVAVVGSANLDLVVSVSRFPHPGETVLAEHYEEVPGGKGLNQAVAAAANGPAALIGCVGTDEAGERLLDRLTARGVGVDYLRRVGTPTGRAFIQVSADGENSIVVSALANRRLDGASVVTALDALRPAVVLAQLEVPLETVEAAAAWAASCGARFVLNASPARPLSPSLVAKTDPLIVNVVEAEAYAPAVREGVPTEAADLARSLSTAAASVVVTAGGRGAYVAIHPEGVTHVAAPKVEVIDATGAGDAFAGTLASALSHGAALLAAVELATDTASKLLPIPRHER